MPPKKKGKGKKGATLIDGVDTSAMNRDQLEAFALRLKAEMEREREERNFFQLERDKIRTFWDISRQQLEETRTELRQKDHEVEMAHEMADVESKHITQQMKHLQYESHTKTGEIRAEAMTQLQVAQEEYMAQEQELLKDKRELKAQIRELAETFELQTQQMKMRQFQEISENRIRFENEARDMELLNHQKMQALKQSMELTHRMEMFEVEERKNTQIKRLISGHDEAFNELKNYYNVITLNNLALISSLKERMESLVKQIERAERSANELQIENRKLKDPLEQAQAELASLRVQLEHFDRDRHQLSRLKLRNKDIEKKLKDLTLETEILLMRNESLVKEREEVKAKFEEIVMELQQKAGLKNVMLERKIAHLEREIEKREVVLNAHRLTIGCDHQKKLREHVESSLEEKNKMIKDLQYEMAKICKAHDDMISAYEGILAKYGIPKRNVGFEPVRFSSKYEYLCGPAGLVTKNK